MKTNGPTLEGVGWGAIKPDDIANLIKFILDQLQHVPPGKVVINPPGQRRKLPTRKGKT